jgi:DNA (cytosine-5)-methyltransferase 1
MKLGSLFDGSGGFPLAGAINGITPVWASEIEPYPIRVTKARLPNMKHLGSVLDVKEDTIEPVDIITFGSPCQDLSVAGKQLGIHAGERSNLFFEAVRIAKEMRNHDRATGRSGVDVRPRFLIWENVPGAFSSNQGEDFRSVLEALGGIAEDGVSISRPPKGKWQHAGCVVGDGWSIAWRLYDAQHWGVPQRRKRIYLIADLASERAGEILFERESLCGDPAESGEAREGTADHAEGSAGGSGFFEPASLMEENWRETPVSGALRAEASKSSHAVVWSFKGGQGPKAGSIGYQEEQSPTLTSANSGTNTVPDVVYQNTGIGWWNEAYVAETLRTPCGGDSTKANLVVYDCRGNGDGENVPTLTGDHGRRVSDYSAVTVYDTTQNTSPLNYSNPKLGDPCHPLAANQHPPLCVGNGQMCNITMQEISNSMDCMHDQQAVLMEGKPPRKYIVRRLTPLECCRLQGFPDWWEDGVEGSDSARYKMWGNGIALPCAVDVLRRIAKTIKESENDEQR